MPKERYTDDSYSLTKALFNLSSAKQFLELIRIDTKGEVKNTFNNLIARIDFVINFVTHKVSDDDRELLKKELADSISVQVIVDGLVKLNPQERELIENLITAMLKGEKIIVDEKRTDNTPY